ncbi:AMP-binding protein [Methylobacter sp. YRD-M1]|uniref:AMP-binding protein n=1 Tax=Methylobacter sp. YRD-M1 TaxID=2911520 RepID=UPI00227C1FE6|nr:AMP-binding protein [Methylobacter sp. YRD-M1]WAK02148.1 AMP-binding protein [Methylobacter sp. YRD-M1]
MSDRFISLSECLTAKSPADAPVSWHGGRYYHAGKLQAAVCRWTDKLRRQPERRYALYTEDAYPFAVLLFALLYADKEVWIPGNNRPGTAEQLKEQGCRLIGDWHEEAVTDYLLNATPCPDRRLAPLDPSRAQLVMFTSGSTGEAKPVPKRLIQLQREVETLEKQWGRQLADAVALATVSHQHIYGLLFRILWPLSAGRCFHSRIYFDAEAVAHCGQERSVYWVASPAHLKRLDQPLAADFAAVFSSGGPLSHEAAMQVLACCVQSAIEIFGSTESGGIAWRRQGPEPVTPWTLFEGMVLTHEQDRWRLQSPYLLDGERLELADQIEPLDDGRFILAGRLDRIVKVEEKRLSLSEMEQRLIELPWIAEAVTLMIAKSRDTIGAGIVLNQDGRQLLAEQGRPGLIRQLREALHHWFDAVVLPRKWLILDSIPLTAQGKTDTCLLNELLASSSRKLPQVLGLNLAPEHVELKLLIPPELVYFKDHFRNFPILPGVVQIAWAEHYGKLFFEIDRPFSHMDVIKFVRLIEPGNTLTLSLEWNVQTGKLYFTMSSKQGPHSSGRLVYGKTA